MNNKQKLHRAMKNDQVTVGELIEYLYQLDPDLPVVSRTAGEQGDHYDYVKMPSEKPTTIYAMLCSGDTV